MKKSAGLIIFNSTTQKVLLAHPTGRGLEWHFPKGGIEEGEDFRMAAVRETSEEIGVQIPDSMVGKTPDWEITYTKGTTGKAFKKVYLFLVVISDYSELYFGTNGEIPQFIPNEEMDKVGFFGLQEAEKIIFFRFRGIIQELKNNWI